MPPSSVTAEILVPSRVTRALATYTPVSAFTTRPVTLAARGLSAWAIAPLERRPIANAATQLTEPSREHRAVHSERVPTTARCPIKRGGADAVRVFMVGRGVTAGSKMLSA